MKRDFPGVAAPNRSTRRCAKFILATFRVHVGFTVEVTGDVTVEATGEVTDQLTDQVADPVTGQVEEPAALLLSGLAQRDAESLPESHTTPTGW